MKIKDFGQVFTPGNIVVDILNLAGYYGENVLKKHVIDNSCGNGAFLIEVVRRYIDAYMDKYNTLKNIEEDLNKYIHGIEKDFDIYNECIDNLSELIKKYNINNISFDIINADALLVDKYNQKMDFVVGNPPYVRVHNLNEEYDLVKKFSFCSNGMTDLYIVFYEIGLKMLNENGILCYISPNSFYNSLAGSKMRDYIMNNQSMEVLMDLGHYKPFNVNTYTTICKIVNGSRFGFCKYYKYDLDSGIAKFVLDIKYKNLFVNNNIILSSNGNDYFKYLNYDLSSDMLVQVKNGFATLNDKVFINDKFDFKDNVIKVVKASTGMWKYCVYPYDNCGNLISFEELGDEVKKYFLKNKDKLIKDNSKVDSLWYAFGRSQAIKDVKFNKIAINTCIKDIDSIKLNLVKAGEGVYSGLYMLTDVSFDLIKEKICSSEFIDYLKLLNKCKSGGYYTFSSKDLARFINCSLECDFNE